MAGQRVTFGAELRVDVREINPLKDHAAIWWSKSEIKEFEREYEAVLFLMDANNPIDEEEHSSRGLEKKTEQGAWMFYEHHRDALNAVLGEQENIQRTRTKAGSSEQIASVYQDTTTKTRELALERGLQDYAEIKGCPRSSSHCLMPYSPKVQLRQVSPPNSPYYASPSKRGWGRKMSMPLMSPRSVEYDKLIASPFKEKIVKAAAMELARQQVSAKKMVLPKDDCSLKDDASTVSLSTKEKTKDSSIKADESLVTLTKVKKTKTAGDGKKVKKSTKGIKSIAASPDKRKRQKSISTKATPVAAESDFLIVGSTIVHHNGSKTSTGVGFPEFEHKKTIHSCESPLPTLGEQTLPQQVARVKSANKQKNRASKSTQAAATSHDVDSGLTKGQCASLSPKLTSKKPTKKTTARQKKSSQPRPTCNSSFTSMEQKLAKLSTNLDALLIVKKLPDDRSSASTELWDSGDDDDNDNDDERSVSYLPVPRSVPGRLSPSAVSPNRGARFLLVNRVMEGIRHHQHPTFCLSDWVNGSSISSCLDADDGSLEDSSESAESCCF